MPFLQQVVASSQFFDTNLAIICDLIKDFNHLSDDFFYSSLSTMHLTLEFDRRNIEYQQQGIDEFMCYPLLTVEELSDPLLTVEKLSFKLASMLAGCNLQLMADELLADAKHLNRVALGSFFYVLLSAQACFDVIERAESLNTEKDRLVAARAHQYYHDSLEPSVHCIIDEQLQLPPSSLGIPATQKATGLHDMRDLSVNLSRCSALTTIHAMCQAVIQEQDNELRHKLASYFPKATQLKRCKRDFLSIFLRLSDMVNTDLAMRDFEQFSLVWFDQCIEKSIQQAAVKNKVPFETLAAAILIQDGSRTATIVGWIDNIKNPEATKDQLRSIANLVKADSFHNAVR